MDNNEHFISISTSIFSKNFHNNGININIQSSNLQHQFWFQYYHLLSKTSKPTSILSTVFFNISMDIDISKWILEYHNDFNNRGPEASGSRKRLVWQKNAILNMARPMKNSGTLPWMTFTEMAFKGHNRHSESLNNQ